MLCLGLEPGAGMMEGADESTELWRDPIVIAFLMQEKTVFL